MVIIGLLLIALACLVLGLAMQSTVWLVASLIATAGAGYLLYKLRDVIAAPKKVPPAEVFLPAEVAKAAVQPHTAGAAASEDTAPTDDGRPLLDVAGEPMGGDAGAEVWVIDGRPRYHLGNCAIIKGQDAEPIPFEQATEDGFMPCSLCEPHAVAR